MISKLPKILLASVLSLSLFSYGCSSAQFFQVLDQVAPAVLTVLQIIATFQNKPVDMRLSAKVGADVAGIEKLYEDWKTANPTSAPGIKADIDRSFNVLNSDLSTVFSLAQVSNPNVQAQVTVLVTLIQSGVHIAEAIISPNASAAPTTLDAKKLQNAFNRELDVKTGNAAVDKIAPTLKLHEHSKPVRFLTLGYAN